MPLLTHRSITILAALLLAGCVTTQQAMVREGYLAGYAEGFDDGCHSGRKAGGNLFEQFRKDVRRFERDRDYASGWSDAFRQCESEQESAARQARMAIEQQRLRELRQPNKLSRQHELEREALRGVDTSGLKGLK